MGRPIKHYGKWRIRWISASGKRLSAVFDRYQEAVDALILYQAEAKKGQPPSLQGADTHFQEIDRSHTFDELCDHWIRFLAVQKKNPKDDQSIIRAHLRPALTSRELRTLNLMDIYSLKETLEKKKLSKKTIRNILLLLGSMFKEAVQLKWASEFPNIKLPSAKSDSSDFKYLKTNEEIQRFLISAELEGEAVFMLYATAIYTGMRQGELAMLEWSDVSFEKRLITVQRSFNGSTKSDRVRHVPILDALFPSLLRWKSKSFGDAVFYNEHGNHHGKASRVFKDTLHRILKRAKFPELKFGKRSSRYICFHDLRHTFASHWVMNGGDLYRLQRILGHQDTQMTLRYAHLSPEAYTSDHARLGQSQLQSDPKILKIK